MYLTDSAAHWYHTFKQNQERLSWEQFRQAVLLEFDTDTHQVKMKELLQLKQTDTMAEYHKQFDRLVYNIKLYDPAIGGVMLVTQFLLGLKEEIRAAVEAQLPNIVQRATLLAQIHEGLLELKAPTKAHKQYPQPAWKEQSGKFATGEVWKAQQLKEYRRVHGLCYKCGEKYAPGHQCTPPVVAQLKAMQVDQTHEFLSDEILEVVTGMESMTLNDTERLSLHALQGTDTDSTIHLPAEINNLTMLMLIDSGSTSSFLDASMVSKLGLIPQARPPVYVKVANGDRLLCTQVIPNFTWSTQGHKFTHNMQVLDMGGYEAVLGMDWLQKFRPMNCDWVAKWLEFEHEGGLVKL
uniref:Uncharacterized protein n=1 Tax=Avena sativa TaxID=4498 RepID=A0ACD5UZ83_AVESA